jgi:hypothetical protein
MRRLFAVFIFKNGVSIYMFLRKQLTETIVWKQLWPETIANRLELGTSLKLL